MLTVDLHLLQYQVCLQINILQVHVNMMKYLMKLVVGIITENKSMVETNELINLQSTGL